MDAGQVVRDWRRRDGLTQEQLAHRAGMHQEAVARLEAGHQVPRVDTFLRLLAACGAGLRIERPLDERVDRAPIRDLLAKSPAGGLLRNRTKGLDPAQVFRMLTWWRVSFVVVGGLAARLNGVPTTAGSIEICLARTRRNRERLGRALERLEGPSLAIPPAVGTYPTAAGRIRCLRVPYPIGSYDELVRASIGFEMGFATPVRVACAEDLLRIRLASRRRVDRLQAALLTAATQERSGPP